MNQFLFGLFTFAAGLLVGHRLSLGREKRKEFNEAIQPVRSIFLAESESPSPYREMPSREAFDLLVQVMSPWSRRGFRSALERFNVSKKAAKTRDELGQVLYTDTSAIKAAAKHVLTYTKRR